MLTAIFEYNVLNDNRNNRIKVHLEATFLDNFVSAF